MAGRDVPHFKPILFQNRRWVYGTTRFDPQDQTQTIIWLQPPVETLFVTKFFV